MKVLDSTRRIIVEKVFIVIEKNCANIFKNAGGYHPQIINFNEIVPLDSHLSDKKSNPVNFEVALQMIIYF
jgi:hypothetical protein